MSGTALQDTTAGSQGPALLIPACEELKAGPGAQPAAPKERQPLRETCLSREASRPPPAEQPGRPEPRCPSGGGGRRASAHGQAGLPPRPGAAQPPSPPLPHPGSPAVSKPGAATTPAPPPPPPRRRHTPPHAGRRGDTPLPQRESLAARPAGASGRPRPGASCGLGPPVTGPSPRLRPGPAPRPAGPPGQARALPPPGRGPPPPRPSPRRLPPSPRRARPSRLQPSPPPRPRASLTPRSRRGSAVAGWALCCARCRRLPWRGRCAGRRRQRRRGGARGSQPGFQAGQLEPGATTGEAVEGREREEGGRPRPTGRARGGAGTRRGALCGGLSRPPVSVATPLSQRGAPTLRRRSAPDSTMRVPPRPLRRLASPCPERDGFAEPPDQLGVAYTIAHRRGEVG